MFPNNAFVHHVFFWLKNPHDENERIRLLEGLRSLRPIVVVRQCHIGIPADTRRPVIDSSYDFSLLLVFDNETDQELYQQDPIHQQFVTDCSPLWSRVVIYDAAEL